jgi:selenocysteine lyase/cysteine desulfurase
MPALAHSSALDAAAREFDGGRDYLAACTVGLPSHGTRRAVIAELEASASGHPDLAAYGAAVERSRALFGSLVGIGAERVAIGSQTSVAAGLVASALPAGAEVLVPEGEFSSLVLPFVHSGRQLAVRTAPLHGLADHVRSSTALVAFSVVQSATGEVADAAAIVGAASRHDTLTLCDATQAVGWLPVEAARYDALVCHAYKWLCAPRGVSFLTVSDRLASRMSPIHAGWYAGDDPWSSCYGGAAELAPDARRFDVSPAWQAFVGAAPALALFAALDPAELLAHTTGLAAAFRDGLGIPQPERASAIVTWDDPEGAELARLTGAGITASGRSRRARVAFHVFNDEDDVDLALAALGH